MPTYFPDTTVLINFGLIGRIPLLGQLIRNPTWCATIEEECADQFQQHGIDAFDQAKDVFGEALRPEPTEQTNALLIRNAIASAGDPHRKHYGEAETIAIATSPSRDHERPAVFITDDVGAAKAANVEAEAGAPIRTVTTWQLLRAAFRAKHLTIGQVWDDLRTLRSRRRGWPKGVEHTYQAVREWLGDPPA